MQTVSRLIHQFIPDHYQLSLNLNRTNRTFEGTVTVEGTSILNTSEIILHAKNLAVQSVVFDGKRAEFTVRDNDEIVISHPDIYPAKHIIVISFNGTITDAMHGLYPCYYDHNGVKKELLTTQFESHHAREVFPCIDEPEAKATFDVTLSTEPNIVVLGNMPIKHQRVEDDRLLTTFQQTPRMSTYLLAWVVGELQKKTTSTARGIEVSIWATPAQPADNLDFALDQAIRTIDFFEGYFGVDYPLPKSDHVALPDFSSGAMENWGLITYREIALLSSPTASAVSSKQYIATVIAHELSHQWFGNLVTMKWWNNLWLNESFATLMEYIAIDTLHPDWNIWLDFSTAESILALRRDALEGVQPVQTEVNHPDEISTLFDGAIVYAKGARLMRMLQQYVGDEAFQAGLRQYFITHAYGNTEEEDLWRVFSEASGKDISGFMNTWIAQPGYPVVHITRRGDTVRLKQEQFFIGPHEPSAKLWPIPLDASLPALPELFKTKELAVPLIHSMSLRLNADDTNHFLTHYDTLTFRELIATIDSSDTMNRLQLLHEQTLLARGGVVATASLIPLLDIYKNETSEAVWSIIALSISELKKFVETNKSGQDHLRLLTRTLARKQYQRLGWGMISNESESDTKLRAIIIGLMLYGEDPDTIKTALSTYQAHELEQLDPELRPLIISAVVRHRDDNTVIDHLIDAYRTTASADLKEDITSGITTTNSEVVVQRLLRLITDESTIRPQDVARWFVYLIRNRDGRKATWLWLQDRWDWIEKTFDGDKSYDDFPRYAASGLATRRQLDEYRTFFTSLQDKPALTRVISMGISEIEARVDLIERDSNAVRDALAKLAS